MKRIPFLAVFCFILSTGSVFAQDWAQLKEFQIDNRELKMMPSEGRVVFFGNSITIGWLQAMPSFFKDRPFINRGIGGQTTPQMLVRFRQDVLDLKPEVVVILAGTNDIAGNTGPMTLDEILGNLKSMAELAKANNIKVILCSVLPASDYPWRPGPEPHKKIPALNAMIKEYTELAGVHYLDYYAALVNDKNGMDSDLANDGVHPTKAGYEIMAPLALKAINKALHKSD
ncbi:SGNH/GDSL hydrolase family protein [uncultured Muriicola sp.]|uniref:SGNH/GDSL hydrolase family protein n=1 Tax=uncultured Muriicola sp. TaxID=1583102 RepID=UPI002613FAE8|nr:SGNH/GDSL hydrolase family protein [uncultured Muriicola sp.]